MFLDLEVFFRFMKSESRFWILEKPMDHVIHKLITHLKKDFQII